MRIYTEQWVELRVLLGELRVQWGFHLSAVGRQTTTSALKWDPALNRDIRGHIVSISYSQ